MNSNSTGSLMDHGKFSGEPHTEWLTESGEWDRRMRLCQDFTFVLAERTWTAKKGSTVDGASIPQALWSIVGAPYVGNYRRASIVHDVACDEAGNNVADRLAADRMFYHACRAGGCNVQQAIILYLGVRFGAVFGQVQSWQEANEVDLSTPRIAPTGAEEAMARDFYAVATQLLAAGETDDSDELEHIVTPLLETMLAWQKANHPTRNTSE